MAIAPDQIGGDLTTGNRVTDNPNTDNPNTGSLSISNYRPIVISAKADLRPQAGSAVVDAVADREVVAAAAGETSGTSP